LSPAIGIRFSALPLGASIAASAVWYVADAGAEGAQIDKTIGAFWIPPLLCLPIVLALTLVLLRFLVTKPLAGLPISTWAALAFLNVLAESRDAVGDKGNVAVSVGLSVSKQIVERFGGKIEAINRPVRGAIFAIPLRTLAYPEAGTEGVKA
jgi:hypothetical protein